MRLFNITKFRLHHTHLASAVLFILFAACALRAAPINIGDRLELFWDNYLVDKTKNVELRLAQPRNAGVVLKFDEPWERASGFVAVIKDDADNIYRMYYRGMARAGEAAEDFACYAESKDGITWTKPSLGLIARYGRTDTNIMIADTDGHRVAHNFAVLLDTRPGVPHDERYKAVGGKGPTGKPSPGLFRYVSGDGVHWKLFDKEPIFEAYALDSLNVPVWLPEENCYAIYLRIWTEGGTPDRPKFKGIRTIARSTSKDFKTWTKPEMMDFGDTPMEHIYTNNTHTYFRAPHMLISMGFRLMPSKIVYPLARQKEWGVPEAHAKGVSDAIFMTSRGGQRYDRTFMESFIRPGQDKRQWHARETQPSLGVVPTSDNEMSFYVINHYPMPTEHLTRYVLRTDGFASAHAGYTEGTLLTKPFVYSGEKLILNFATSAAGNIKVELLNESGGRVLATTKDFAGDEIAAEVEWTKGANLAAQSGKPVRLRFTMKDADIYSFRFSK